MNQIPKTTNYELRTKNYKKMKVVILAGGIGIQLN